MMTRLTIGCIRFYKSAISPHLPAACRFTPTCSEYAIEALDSRGFWVGIRLTIFRLLRCHPWHPGGFDPVDKS